jgi:flagellar biosynthetic protein FlhB
MALEDKTEAPTPRKRLEARQEGQVARSVELGSAMVLIASLLLIKYSGPGLVSNIKAVAINSLSHFPTRDLTVGTVTSDLAQLLLQTGSAIAPLIIGVAVVGFAASALQVGLVFSGKALAFKAERLNPISGIARMFSARAAVELLKSIAKILIVGYIVFSFLRDRYTDIESLVGGDYLTSCSVIGQLTWALLLRSAMCLFVIAGLDYIFQKMQLEKQLRMTKQEVKEDYKRTEGDPLIKSRIRQKQRELSKQRMMQEVPRADVVITNPTHYAVALKYDVDKSTAPVVIAKGQRLVAQRIKEIAAEAGVPVVENVQLARALYASVEIGQEIPADLYQAVAEILAYVYRLSHRLRAA